MSSISLQPCGPTHSTIRPPGSKSITNRALICAALADGSSQLFGVLDADDTRYMAAALESLGFQLQADWVNSTIRINGLNGKIPKSKAELFVGNSGTSIRFLIALCALGEGRYLMDGDQRMRQRPIKDLVAAMKKLDIDIQAETDGECPPVVINANGIQARTSEIRGNVSSQYLSALMMVAPRCAAGLEISIVGEFVSQPYVRMTQRVMQSFGIDSLLDIDCDPPVFKCDRSPYQACQYEIEPDASAASYFWAAAAITGGHATVEGLTLNALQGDVQFVSALQQMGCTVEQASNSIRVSGKALRGIDINMADISDTAQTLAVVALFVKGTTTIRGIAHNRVKETDRIGNLAIELRKLGATVEEFDDGLSITPGELRPALIETYDDHRMAMSISLAGLQQEGVKILDPGCTAKTYPNFFDDMARFTSTKS